MSAQTLYDITESHVRLLEMLENGDITEAQKAEYIDNDLADVTEAKLRSYAEIIRNKQAAAAIFDAERKAFADESKFYADKRDAANAVVESMKGRLKYHLETLGLSSVPAGPFTIALQANPPAVEVDDVHALPETLQVVTVAADKRAIKERLDAGDEIPGCRLTRGMSLRIR